MCDLTNWAERETTPGHIIQLCLVKEVQNGAGMTMWCRGTVLSTDSKFDPNARDLFQRVLATAGVGHYWCALDGVMLLHERRRSGVGHCWRDALHDRRWSSVGHFWYDALHEWRRSSVGAVVLTVVAGENWRTLSAGTRCSRLDCALGDDQDRFEDLHTPLENAFLRDHFSHHFSITPWAVLFGRSSLFVLFFAVFFCF